MSCVRASTAALASLFIRGGNPDSNQVNEDGVPIGDIGGAFDYSNLSATGIGDLEVYRGPNSVLYGSDAASGCRECEDLARQHRLSLSVL